MFQPNPWPSKNLYFDLIQRDLHQVYSENVSFFLAKRDFNDYIEVIDNAATTGVGP